MTQKYADLFQTVFLTCFYAPALPVCILLSMGGLLVGYWVDKVVESYLYLPLVPIFEEKWKTQRNE